MSGATGLVTAGHLARGAPAARGTISGSVWTHESISVEDLTEADVRKWMVLAQHPIAFPAVAVECWQHLCHHDGDLFVHRVSEDGRPVAFVPLARGGRLFRSWRAPCHREVGRVCFAFRGDGREALAVLLDSLLGLRGEVLEVNCLTVNSPTYDALRHAGERCGLRIVEDTVAHVPFKRLQCGWDAFWASIGSKTRREFGRRERQLERGGSLEFGEVSGGDRLQDIFTECLEVEASGYKRVMRTALKYREVERSFWQHFVAVAAQQGILALYTLRLDGRLVSFDLCAKANGVIYELKHGTDAGARAFSAGSVLHLKLFRQEIETGETKLYDFAGQVYEWKLRWTKDVVPLVRLRLYVRTWRGWLAYLAGPGWRHAAKRIPGLARFVCWLRGGGGRAPTDGAQDVWETEL